MLLALLVLVATTTPPALEVTVVVPLCDNALIACGRAPAGAPRALDTNLYWGAMYGFPGRRGSTSSRRLTGQMGGSRDCCAPSSSNDGPLPVSAPCA